MESNNFEIALSLLSKFEWIHNFQVIDIFSKNVFQENFPVEVYLNVISNFDDSLKKSSN